MAIIFRKSYSDSELFAEDVDYILKRRIHQALAVKKLPFAILTDT